MVFIGGPRQVGKTTCSLTFLSPSSPSHRGYLNWDVIESQKKIKSGQIPPEPIIILDEIHKFKNWRNLVKGFYDQNKEFQKFIVTGSARLDHYRRGGDSLLGRYRYLRLHPLSIGELKISNLEDQNQLLKLGGFPEPFLNGTEKEWRLWQKERIYRLVNDDIRSLENLREYSSIELLAESLIVRVGSPLSVYSLSQELQFNFRTIESWIKILEQVYYCFRISPFGAPKIRAVKKEKKLYLWDWSSCSHKGARFENMVASHLLKYCHFLEDSQGHSMELRYLRDTDKREVDFVVVKNGKALFAVECKTGESSLSKNVSYFMQRTDVPFFYQVHLGTKDYVVGPKARVLPFNTFCQEEQIP
ncbi:MAG: AAA family ATPase [Bdellovibrionaceae bacterium]|nr:AAA family ATPase [Pseudobdellovibrionaceae bacterium]|tara:strand:- start:196 stop:1272 length:1077 start_codon:yes stop_codon:yes gene_type:complete